MNFPNYWENGFENLTCLYYGSENDSHFEQIWENKLNGHEVDLLHHVCLNGSFSHLSLEQWNDRCFPTHNENFVLRRITGFWSLFNFIAGLFGNLLTLVAIPYAKWKHRYDFHSTFWTTDIWILHLAFCDLIFSIFCAPHYFIPYLGYRYPQGYGSDTACTVSFIVTILTFTNDWLLVAIVAMTRAISLKQPTKWERFCGNKAYVFLFLLSTWVFQLLVMLPIFLQPSIDIGYNCLMGKCNYVPTGKDPLDIFVGFVGQPVFVGLPYLAAFLTPCIITTISYVIIWRHVNNVKNCLEEMDLGKEDQNGKRRLTKQEIRFIWTVFIICLCYLLCALPGIILVDILGMKDGTTFLISLSLLWFQFSINIFVYAYRSKRYRSAYEDLVALIFPLHRKHREDPQSQPSNKIEANNEVTTQTAKTDDTK